MKIFFLTVDETAKILDVKLKHVYYLVYMGTLEAWKIRGTWRIFLNSVEDYAKSINDGSFKNNVAVNFNNQGNGENYPLLGINHPTNDLGKGNRSLPNGRGVEYKSNGLAIIPIETLKPIKNKPIQLELNFEVAI